MVRRKKLFIYPQGTLVDFPGTQQIPHDLQHDTQVVGIPGHTGMYFAMYGLVDHQGALKRNTVATAYSFSRSSSKNGSNPGVDTIVIMEQLERRRSAPSQH